MKLRSILLVVAGVLVAGAAFMVWMIGGPSMVLGMLRYDERKEGKYVVGDAAPDVSLVRPDGSGRVAMATLIGRRPLVLIFGSYT